MDENILFSLEGEADTALGAIDEAMGSLGSLAESASATADAVSASLGGLDEAFGSLSTGAGGLDALFGSLGESLSALQAQVDAATGSFSTLDSSASATSAQLDALDASATSASGSMGTLGASADATAGQMDAARGSTEGFGSGMSGLGMPLLAATAAVGGVGIASLHMASQYQSSMAVVQALTGQSATQMSQFNTQVLSMSGQLGVPAKQLGDGLYYVLSAGVKAKDAMGVLKVVTEASAAGMVDASTDADALTSAINAYGAGAGQAQHYQDMLLVALRDGKTTMQELSTSIGRAAVTGNAAGFSFNQVAAAMSTMTLSGSSAHIAGMQLSNLFRAIGINAATVAANAKKMGVSFDSAKFSSLDLIGRLQYLMEVTKGNKAEMLKLTGGAAGFQAAMQLLNNKSQAYTKILGDMSNAQGMTAKAFAIHQQTMAAEWDKVKVAGENALIKLGQALAPLAQEIGGKILPALNRFSAWVSAHPAAMRTAFLGIAAAISAIAVAFVALGPGAKLANGALKLFTDQSGTLNKVLLGLKDGMGGLITRANATGTAFGEGLSTKLLQFGLAVRHPGLALDVLKGKLSDLASVGSNALSWAGSGITHIGQFTSSIGELASTLGHPTELLGLLRTGFMGMAQGVLGAIPALAGMAASLGAVLVPLLLIAGAVALGIIIFTKFHSQMAQVGSFLGGQLKPIFTDIHNTIQTFLTMVQLKWQETWPKLRPAVLDLINAFKALSPVLQIVGTVISVVLKVILGLVTGVVSGFLDALPQIAGFFAAVFRFIGDFGSLIQAVFSGQFGKIPSIVGDILRQIGLLFQNGLGMVLTFVGHTILGIAQWFDALTGGALTGVVNFINGVIHFFEHLVDTLVGHSIVPDLINSVVHFFSTLPSRVLGAVQGLLGKMGGFFHNLASQALGWGRDMISSLVNGIKSINVGGAIGGIASTIKNFLHFSKPDEGPLADFDTWMSDMGDQLVKGMNDQQDKVKQAASQLAGAVQQGMSPSGASSGLSGVASGLNTPLGGGGNVEGLLRELIGEVRNSGRAMPIGSNITPATLGAVTQHIGAVNLSAGGQMDVNTLYQIFNEMAGLAVEFGGRGATAGMGV